MDLFSRKASEAAGQDFFKRTHLIWEQSIILLGDLVRSISSHKGQLITPSSCILCSVLPLRRTWKWKSDLVVEELHIDEPLLDLPCDRRRLRSRRTNLTCRSSPRRLARTIIHNSRLHRFTWCRISRLCSQTPRKTSKSIEVNQNVHVWWKGVRSSLWICGEVLGCVE